MAPRESSGARGPPSHRIAKNVNGFGVCRTHCKSKCRAHRSRQANSPKTASARSQVSEKSSVPTSKGRLPAHSPYAARRPSMRAVLGAVLRSAHPCSRARFRQRGFARSDHPRRGVGLLRNPKWPDAPTGGRLHSTLAVARGTSRSALHLEPDQKTRFNEAKRHTSDSRAPGLLN